MAQIPLPGAMEAADGLRETALRDFQPPGERREAWQWFDQQILPTEIARPTLRATRLNSSALPVTTEAQTDAAKPTLDPTKERYEWRRVAESAAMVALGARRLGKGAGPHLGPVWWCPGKEAA